MKFVYTISALVSAITLSATLAHASVPFSELNLILQDPSVAQLFADNHVTSFESISQRGPIAACGRNTPVGYSLVVMQAGVWKPCTVNILVKPADGQCHGISPRIVELKSGLVCPE